MDNTQEQMIEESNSEPVLHESSPSGVSEAHSHTKSLSEMVHLLGGLLGETIIEQEGQAIFDQEEDMRALAKSWRTSSQSGSASVVQSINAVVAKLLEDVQQARAVLKAFTTYFQLVNLAEEQGRVNILRQRTQGRLPRQCPNERDHCQCCDAFERRGLECRRYADDPQFALNQPRIYSPPHRNQTPYYSGKIEDPGRCTVPVEQRDIACP